MRVLRRQEMEDIVLGASLLGAGGGGSPAQGKKLADYVMSLGGEVRLVGVDEVGDNEMVAVVGGMGSPAAALEKGIFNAHIRAFEALERAIGERIHYVIPLETGGGNSVGPMAVPAKKGLAIVDGDGAGRAIPELEMTTFAIYGVPISPFALANETDVSVVVYAGSAYDCESVARAVCTSFGMVAGFATHAMLGGKMKEVTVPGSITVAEQAGRLMREAGGKKGKDAVDHVVRGLNGYLIARGRVKSVESKTTGGFDFGSVVVEDHSEKTLVRVDFKNENMICWKEDRPVAMIPDLICWLRTDGYPLTNADIAEGLDVAVLGFRAHEKWRNPAAYGVFKHALSKLGYTGEYVPIEKLIDS